MRAEYRLEPCRTALNRVKGMSFRWSLNPYMGCAHQCTFCFVRAFESLADRPADDRYGTSIRVKTNLVEVLRRELTRPAWNREQVAVGTATDPYQPAEGRWRLTRRAIKAFGEFATPFGIITRGPLIVRDLDVLADAARMADVSVTFSVPTLDPEIWRLTEPGTAPPRQRLRALRAARGPRDQGQRRHGADPARPVGSAGPPRRRREGGPRRGATGVWANLLYLKPGTREHFLDHLARDWPELVPTYEALYARAPTSARTSWRRQGARRRARPAHGIEDRRSIRSCRTSTCRSAPSCRRPGSCR